MKRYGSPVSIVADRLPSYRAAMKTIGVSDRQETKRRLNNRTENAHQPFQRWEGTMAKFRDVETLRNSPLSRLDPQTFQPRTTPHAPRNLKAEALNRPGRVAPNRGVNRAAACCSETGSHWTDRAATDPDNLSLIGPWRALSEQSGLSQDAGFRSLDGCKTPSYISTVRPRSSASR